MNKLTETKTLTLIGFFVLGISCSPALADLDPLEMYDDFNAKSFNNCKKCIDITKWLGAEKGMSIGEIQRKIKAKRAFFAIRSWGKGTEDVGRTNARNRLIFRDDPGSITGVCFTPRVKKMELNDCEANEDAYSGVRIRYSGTVYDSNNASENDQNGVVGAMFSFSHNTRNEEAEGLKKGEFIAWGDAYQCSNNDCSENAWTTENTGSDETNPDLNFGVFKKSNKTEFCVGYDSSNHELVFSAGDDIRTVNADNNLPARVADVHSNQVWQVIEVRTDAPNCQTDGMVSVYLEGDVDNIKVRRRP